MAIAAATTVFPYHFALYSSIVRNCDQLTSLIAMAKLWVFNMFDTRKSSIPMKLWFLIISAEFLCKYYFFVCNFYEYQRIFFVVSDSSSAHSKVYSDESLVIFFLKESAVHWLISFPIRERISGFHRRFHLKVWPNPLDQHQYRKMYGF